MCYKTILEEIFIRENIQLDVTISDVNAVCSCIMLWF